MINIVVSAKSQKPIYEQIYEQMVSQILSGALPANLCLPSIRAVAKEIGISIITIKKAWEMLESNDFIYTVAGKGCFVSAHTHYRLEDKKTSLAKNRLLDDLAYYKTIGLTKEELLRLISESWEDNN